ALLPALHSTVPAAARHLSDLHSFPTRRSSDLSMAWAFAAAPRPARAPIVERSFDPLIFFFPRSSTAVSSSARHRTPGAIEEETRSEEHTSELQSQSNLVCRLLLEKKNYSHYRL